MSQEDTSTPIPHYLRFVRALSKVSARRPLGAVAMAGASALACAGLACSSVSAGMMACSGGECGVQVVGGGGVEALDASDADTDAALTCANGCGIQVAEAGGGIEALDGGLDGATDAAGSDASDAGDGGGPHRGIPELPAHLAFVA